MDDVGLGGIRFDAREALADRGYSVKMVAMAMGHIDCLELLTWSNSLNPIS
jgi:hypothetical protein